MKAPFHIEHQADAESAARELDRRRSEADALIDSPEFRSWFYRVMVDLCGLDNGTAYHDDFVQGKRSCASFLKSTLMVSDKAPRFIGDMTARFFSEIQTKEHDK